ncbi:PIR-like protein [Plasmodium gallinaceum]|uniref:PIR-like protein n=1 Tax=Plasmodium gallinaceum TaxID=5849 RepID=A0A1J1GUC6_PLAGA|nr:PIR-like protein [Plasmodium gallinaceum]CRG96085.1 PIR-like protein [Plasmodium gallinaceum]
MLNYSIIIFYLSFLINSINLKTEKFSTTWRILAEHQAAIPLIRTARSTSGMQGSLSRWLQSIEEEFFNNIEILRSNSTGTDDAIQWVKDKTKILLRALNSTENSHDKSLLSQTYSSWNNLTKSLLNFTLDFDFNDGLSTGNSSGSINLLNTSTPSSTSSSFSTSGVAQESSLGYRMSEACSGNFCGSTITTGLSLPFVIIGGLLFFAYLYKFTRIGSFLGRSDIKKERRKRKIYNGSMENIEDPYESSEETNSMNSILESSEETEAKKSRLESSEETEAKRSRLENSEETGDKSKFNSLLKAVGYKYRKIFPYIDSGLYGNENV